MKHIRPLLRPLATMIAAAGFTASAQTTNGTWTFLSSGNASGSWSAATNWQGGAVAGGVDALADFSTLNITATSTVTLDGSHTVGTLKFGDATTASHDWILSGINGEVLTLDVASGAASINVVNRTATISAVLAGNDGINVTGAGTLALTGVNTFTGQLNIAAGSTVSIGVAGALGAGGAGNETIVSSGGVLSVATIGATATHSERIQVAGTGINNNGAIVGSGGTISALQNITLTAPTSFGGTARFNVSGGTLDLGGFKLTKVGTNQIAITGGTVTDGDIDITSGNLSFEAGVALKGSGTVTVGSGTVLGLWANTAGQQTRQVAVNAGGTIRELGSPNNNSTFSSPIRLQGNATVDVLLNVNSQTHLTLAGGISENGGSFGFTRTGPGKLTIGGTNTFTGALNLNTSTTFLGAGATLASSAINVASGAVFDVSPAGGFALGNGQALSAGRTGAPAIDIIGNFTAGTGSTINIGGTTLARTLSFGNDLTLNGATAIYNLSNVATAGSDVNDLIAVGGTLTLSGSNTISVRTAGAAPVAGTYTLATYTGALTGDASNLTISTPANVRQTFTPDLTTTPGSVLLKIAGNAANLTWVGGGTQTWDLNTTVAFTDGTTGEKFFNFDTVAFTDTGSNASDINLNGTLLPSAVTVNATKDYTFSGSGVLSGSAQLTKSGTGKLSITGTNHDFTGGVNFNGGTVSIAEINDAGQPSAIGNGPLNFDGGALEYTGVDGSTNRTLALGNGGGTLSVYDSSAALTLRTSPTGGGRFTKAGAGTLIANYAGAYTGGTTIAAGTLRLANTNALGASGTPKVTVEDGATLDVAGLTPNTKIELTISGNGANDLGALQNSGVGVTNNNIASTVILAADASIGTNSRYDFVGGITVKGGTFTLTKIGTGETWWGPNANAEIGNIVIEAGRFGVQSSGNLGSTAHSIIVKSGGQLSTYGAHSNAKPIVLDGGTLHNNSAAPVAGTAGTWTGLLTLQSVDFTNRIDTFGGPIVLNGKVTGPGGFEKLSTGGTSYGLDLGSPDNDYQGETSITRGTVRIVGSGRISPNSTLVMNGIGAEFDGAGTSQTVAGLRGAAGVIKNVSLTVDTDGNDIFGGQITGATSSLTKEGSGTLILTDATGNTYGGSTTVNEGTLLLAGSISGSSTTVNGGTLGGIGVVGALTLNNGGAIAPGDDGIGTLTASSLIWNGGGRLKFELGVPGVSDVLSLNTGVLDKGTGSGFVFDFVGTGAPNSTYVLATFGSTDFVASDFSFVNLGGANTGSFQVNNNTLVFVTVPEPTTPLMLLCSATALLGLRRRRSGARS